MFPEAGKRYSKNFFLFVGKENPKVKLLGFILHPQAVALREQEDGTQRNWTILHVNNHFRRRQEDQL
jgi:hypothetical protein